MDEDRRIAAVSDVPTDGSLLFTLRDGFDREEAILVRLGGADDDGVHAWKNYCQHWTDVRLDKGSGVTVREGELFCGRHAASFEKGSGLCTHGPCEGAYLDSVAVAVEEGAVYLTDEGYEFDGIGPSGDHDLSTSGGRIDF
jgi:nitrite reductase/ring-hydroxylating ferredoxin subunit